MNQPNVALVPSRMQSVPVLLDNAPMILVQAGPRAWEEFLNFFKSEVGNEHTRKAYAQALRQFFQWCDRHSLDALEVVKPWHVGEYRDYLANDLRRSKPTIKQHLAAIRMFFDHLVVKQIVPSNPAFSVKRPRYVIHTGLTPVLEAGEIRDLIDSIDTSHVIGLRDRAIIGIMLYTFGRVGAIAQLQIEDYYQQGKRCSFRLMEKNGKVLDIPAHHMAEEYVDAYMAAAEIKPGSKGPLFRTTRGQSRKLTDRPMKEQHMLRMIKRRAQDIGIMPGNICCHSFRASGITIFLENGGLLEEAQKIAGHSSPRTTKLYDRRQTTIQRAEIERIRI